jgi:hypothetical protein
VQGVREKESMKNQLLPICFLLFCFSIYQEAKAKFELKNEGNIQSYAVTKPINNAATKHDLNDNVTEHDYTAHHAILANKMVFFQWLGILSLTILCLLLWREVIIIRRKKERQKNELVFCRKETALLDEKSNVLEVNNQIHQKVIEKIKEVMKLKGKNADLEARVLKEVLYKHIKENNPDLRKVTLIEFLPNQAVRPSVHPNLIKLITALPKYRVTTKVIAENGYGYLVHNFNV